MKYEQQSKVQLFYFILFYIVLFYFIFDLYIITLHYFTFDLYCDFLGNKYIAIHADVLS